MPGGPTGPDFGLKRPPWDLSSGANPTVKIPSTPSSSRDRFIEPSFGVLNRGDSADSVLAGVSARNHPVGRQMPNESHLAGKAPRGNEGDPGERRCAYLPSVSSAA